MARRWLCGVGVLVAALTPVACGGGKHAASRPAGPPLSRVCGGVPRRLQATTSWLETSDRVRLFSVEAGSGSTGVVLAHESPGGLCGWLPALPAFTEHDLRVLAFDFRGFPPSGSPQNRRAGDFAPDLQAAVDALHADGASKVFVLGASFGGAAMLKEAPRLHGVTGFVNLSGELDLASIGNVLPAVRRLRAPLLVLASRHDYYLDAPEAKRLVRAAGSADKQLVLYPGSYHGWDLLELAPFKRRVWSQLLGWLDAR
ncbi:MAG: alpha/beta hydrolase [Gaiellaceae bacterium]